MKNNLVAYLTAVLTAICCSACATAGDGQFKIIEKELGNRISLSINEPSCRVSVEFDEKSVNKRKREVIFVRNDCLGNEDLFLSYLDKLLVKVKSRSEVLSRLRAVFVGHLSTHQSQKFAQYAATSPEWKVFSERKSMRGINSLAVRLLYESGAMNSFKSVFSNYDIKLLEDSIEKVSVGYLNEILADSYADRTLNDEIKTTAKVPYQGMLWFSKVEN